jgi:hypothetical protein
LQNIIFEGTIEQWNAIDKGKFNKGDSMDPVPANSI